MNTLILLLCFHWLQWAVSLNSQFQPAMLKLRLAVWLWQLYLDQVKAILHKWISKLDFHSLLLSHLVNALWLRMDSLLITMVDVVLLITFFLFLQLVNIVSIQLQVIILLLLVMYRTLLNLVLFILLCNKTQPNSLFPLFRLLLWLLLLFKWNSCT